MLSYIKFACPQRCCAPAAATSEIFGAVHRLAKSRPPTRQQRNKSPIVSNSGHLGICTACPSTPPRTVHVGDAGPRRMAWTSTTRSGKEVTVCASMTMTDAATQPRLGVVDHYPGASMTIKLQHLRVSGLRSACPSHMLYSMHPLRPLSCPPGQHLIKYFVLRSQSFKKVSL
jgi:hypothetical protein